MCALLEGLTDKSRSHLGGKPYAVQVAMHGGQKHLSSRCGIGISEPCMEAAYYKYAGNATSFYIRKDGSQVFINGV